MPKFSQSQIRGGNSPIPTKMKILSGNPGHQKLNMDEPLPDPGMPEMPEGLCDYAQQEWRECGPGLARMGVLTTVDKGVFMAYCQAFADFKRARIELNRLREESSQDSGSIFVTPTREGGGKRNPLIVVANEAAVLMVRFGAELGLTPSARSKIEVKPIGAQEKSKLGVLLYSEKKRG